MGRSVWTHADAIETVFFVYGSIFESTFESDDLIEDIRETCKAKYPSFENADHWPERESHCIAENSLCQIVISEYCGLVSLGVVPNCDRCYEDISGLAESWCRQYVAPFVRETWGRLEFVCSMSNGEAIFQEC